MELHRTQILLEKDQHQMLASIAEEEKRSLSEVVREMIGRELRYRQRRKMLLAARELQADYNSDPGLTLFTDLYGDEFLFEDEHESGEIWLVNLDPTVGSEVRKTRPAVILGSDLAGILPLKVVVPFTDWKDRYTTASWMVCIEPDKQNGLSKLTAADGLQNRSVTNQRLVKQLGMLTPIQVAQIVQAVVNVLQR